MTTRDYNERNIRKLISEAYNLQELRRLTFESFRPVYEDYSTVKKSELLLQLLAFCERQNLFQHLLDLVREDAPAKYAQYEGRLWTEITEPGLRLELTAGAPAIGLGEAARWTASLHNDGTEPISTIYIRRGRTLLDDPFALDGGESRTFSFVTRPRTPGQKRVRVSADGTLSNGTPTHAAVTGTIEVNPASLPADQLAAGPIPRIPRVFTLTHPISLSLIHIAAGDFLMGADRAKETRAPENERPLHRVSLAGYYLGKHPITNAQYGAFVEATGYQGHEKWDVRGIWILAGVRYPTGDRNHPATYVSWVDATAFCDWLSEESGYLVRLPTEAEWEKAARGIDGRVYPWGNDWDYKRLNTIYSQPDSVTVVGSYSPHGDSPYGLIDMAGNVWEWCADWYDETIYRGRAGKLVLNPTGPADGDRRVVRGGSWSNDRIAARTTFRNRLDPHSRLNNTGFRVALIKPDEP